MKVLITGGAGFIGSHVVDACCERGWEVLCIDSLDQGVYHNAPNYLNPKAEYRFVDLRYWNPDESFKNVDSIVHMAALGGVQRASHDRCNVIGGNVLGTSRLVDFAINAGTIKRFVLASSFSIYGSNYTYSCNNCDSKTEALRDEKNLKLGIYEVLCPKCQNECEICPITENAPASPLEAYGASKFMQELCLRGVDLPIKILRFSSVYGNRLRLDDGEATIIAKLAGWIQSGQTPSLFEDGMQKRDWVHVADVVSAIMAHLDMVESPDIVNVCSGVPTTLVEACQLLAINFNSDIKPKIVGGYRVGDMRHCLGDSSNLKKLIGRDPILFSEGVSILS